MIQTDGPFVAAVGLKDMIIVATDDAILVTHWGLTQDVKAIIQEMKARERKDLL